MVKVFSRKCFVIGPIGHENSENRKRIDSIVDDFVLPCLSADNYEVTVAHKISEPGAISSQVIKEIVNSDLIIADLTDINGNVMYELAIAHCFKKPVITIARKETVLSFDVQQQRTIFYTDSLAGSSLLLRELKNAIEQVKQQGFIIDNPVTQALPIETLPSTGRSHIHDIVRDVLDNMASDYKNSSNQQDKQKASFLKSIIDDKKSEKSVNTFVNSFFEFNETKFYNGVKNHLRKSGLPIQIVKVIEDFQFKNNITTYVFDFILEIDKFILFVKIAPTLLRTRASNEAIGIIKQVFPYLSKADFTQFGFSNSKHFQPLMIIPAKMQNAGSRAVAVPLLKYDESSDTFTNWESVVERFAIPIKATNSAWSNGLNKFNTK